MADSPFDDIKAMSFETALKELEGIVGKLESGQAPLAESIAIYERGEALKAHCEALLKAAEMRIEKITLRGGQPVGTEPLDPQSRRVRTHPSRSGARSARPDPQPRPRPRRHPARHRGSERHRRQQAPSAGGHD
jgi:exodeoxyribonuclease VII small subunit